MCGGEGERGEWAREGGRRAEGGCKRVRGKADKGGREGGIKGSKLEERSRNTG